QIHRRRCGAGAGDAVRLAAQHAAQLAARLARRVAGAITGVFAGAAAAVALAGCSTALPAGDVGAATAEMSPSPMGHYLAGRSAAAEGDMAAAAELLSVGRAADAENTELPRDASLAMVSDGRMAEAGDLARRLIAAGVEDGPA